MNKKDYNLILLKGSEHINSMAIYLKEIFKLLKQSGYNYIELEDLNDFINCGGYIFVAISNNEFKKPIASALVYDDGINWNMSFITCDEDYFKTSLCNSLITDIENYLKQNFKVKNIIIMISSQNKSLIKIMDKNLYKFTYPVKVYLRKVN